MTLVSLSSLSWPWWIRGPSPQKENLYFGACYGSRIDHNPWPYLQCVGNAGIWRLLSVVGDNPAVRERRGSFQAKRFTKQDDYVRNRLWRSQRVEVTRKHTHRSGRHILCCGFLVILGLQIKEFGLSCFKCCERREKSQLWVSLVRVSFQMKYSINNRHEQFLTMSNGLLH